jgi:hypothetical protein
MPRASPNADLSIFDCTCSFSKTIPQDKESIKTVNSWNALVPARGEGRIALHNSKLLLLSAIVPLSLFIYFYSTTRCLFTSEKNPLVNHTDTSQIAWEKWKRILL